MVYWLAFLLFISSNAVSYGYEDIEDEIDRYKRQEINELQLCKDVFDVNRKICAAHKLLRQCKKKEQEEYMAKYCPRTCEFCKNEAPKDCKNTVYGCCWDEITPKQSHFGHNCRRCFQKLRNYRACRRFQDECKGTTPLALSVRRECPVTCGLCKASTLTI